MTKLTTDTTPAAIEALLKDVTRGPWFVGAQNDALYVIDRPPSPAPYDGPIPKEYGPNVICTPNWRGLPDAANARFIAWCREGVPALAAELATARAERDEALERERFTLSDGQRMLRKRDILSVCDMPDTCFETDDGVARCGPCAVKLAGRAGVELNQYTVSNPEAMRLRRELAALRKEVERLRGAMAPFDRMACAMFARNWNNDGVAISFVERDGPIRLTFADFLAVRAALTTEPLGHGVTADFGGES